MVVRIWDWYLAEGCKALFRIGLAIFKLMENKILTAELGDLFIMFKSFRTEVNVEELMSTAFKEFSFAKSDVEKLDKEYRSKKPD